MNFQCYSSVFLIEMLYPGTPDYFVSVDQELDLACLIWKAACGLANVLSGWSS